MFHAPLNRGRADPRAPCTTTLNLGGLGHAILEYGADAFDLAIVETVETEGEAIARERELIADHNSVVPNGFNIRPHAKRADQAEAPLRTSVYFSRGVHDALREIAFKERRAIADIIHEGLDVVLTSRHYPTTAELRGKA